MNTLLHGRKTRIALAVLYLFSQLLFLVNIQFPRGHNFDEFHYVPAAKQILAAEPNQNWEHPPLGKYLIAAGIALDEDRPFGWRLMSTVFGSLTLLAVFVLALFLFRDLNTAVFTALVTLFNQVLYVQARVAMLDTFMFAFTAWALVALLVTWDPTISRRRLKRWLMACGTFFGLAVASKWSGVVPWGIALILVATVLIFRGWTLTYREESDWKGRFAWFRDWYDTGLFARVSPLFLGWSLVVWPVVVYLLTFIPIILIEDRGNGIAEIFLSQVRMWEGQLRVINPHPYMSHWTEWPLMSRPIWYAFDKEGPHGGWVRGVFMGGNPVVMWGGLAAVAASLWFWIRRRSRAAFFICAFYLGMYLSWAVIPRKVSFYYYYYPAAMMLGPALGLFFHVVDRRKIARWVFFAACLAVFIYFFPILAALKIPSDTFSDWMWLESWI